MSAERSRRSRAGVTLVELVIALMLGGMVFLGLGYVFGLNYGLFLRGHARTVLHAGAARALEDMVRTAGQASGLSFPADGELHVFLPRSPIRDKAAPEPESEVVFRLQEGRLLRNGEPLVPHPGDSSVRVAAFAPRLLYAEGSGVPTLQIRLSLHTRRWASAPAETLHFETSAHARNAGLGLGSAGGMAGSEPGNAAGRGARL